VEIVRRMLGAWSEGGFAALAPFAHPDFEMRQMAQHPFAAGTFQGAEAARSMADFMRHFDDFRADIEDIVDGGDDRVVVAVRERGRPRGATIEIDHLFGIVYTLRERKVARMEWFDNPAEALRAVGLEE
jgi:ketosteroid isomerase-like protein